MGRVCAGSTLNRDVGTLGTMKREGQWLFDCSATPAEHLFYAALVQDPGFVSYCLPVRLVGNSETARIIVGLKSPLHRDHPHRPCKSGLENF